MGKMKEVRVKDRILNVKTISFAGMMKIVGTNVTPQSIIELCISKDDYDYLNSIDFESIEQMTEVNKMFEAIMEVNPGLFKVPLPIAQIVSEKTEASGVGNSGQATISGGNPAK